MCARLRFMHPPKVEDQEVQALVRELSVGGVLPSGAAVRVELARRYGSRGGVTRIYRLLAAERVHHGSTALSSIGVRLLEQENRNLRELLQQQRQREDAHQAHWNRQVAELRERVRALEHLVQQAALSGAVTEALKKELQAAEIRGGQLEVQIRTFGPATNRGK
jgi:hypothetical protein